jgi:hypothetical protein
MVVVAVVLALASANSVTAARGTPATAAPLTLTARAASTQFLTPAQIHSAYSLPTRGAANQTIAVVSAYNDPSVQADLNAYTGQYGLPACTTSDKCLRVLNEAGHANPLPAKDPTGGSWITESAVGTEIAHAVCESCSILLVEATSPQSADISAAVQTATQAGATVVETSFNVPESLADSAYFLDYSSEHAAVVAATGDGGYTGNVNFPSSLPDVIAVGGTNLSLGPGGRYGGETAWSDTVSGCSAYDPAAVWQQKLALGAGCGSMRVVTDVAAMSEPGAAVHVTGASTPGGPWYDVSGTSLAAPIIAGAIGLAGSVGGNEGQMIYQHAQSDPGALHHVTTGADSPSCHSVLCRAGRGWNGPTGLGTPDGLAAFLPSGGVVDPHSPDIAVSVPGGELRFAPGFTAQLALRNENPFAVSGTFELMRTLSVGGSLRTIVFATGKLGFGPLGANKETVTVAPGYRGLLQRLGTVNAYAVLDVRGPAGGAVTESTRIALRAPSSAQSS